MKRLLAVASIILLGSFTGVSKYTGTISGLVSDAENGTPVASAIIEVMQGKTIIKKQIASNDGKFTLQVNEGNYNVRVSAKGYSQRTVAVYVKRDKVSVVNVALQKEYVAEELNVESIPAKPGKRYLKICMGELDMMAVGMPSSYGGSFYTADYDGSFIDHNTEEYDFINENGFKDALKDPLSTFSVDVDRASYSNVRRFLTQNQKPYRDAVRIEEMINYFDYDYPQPTDGHPFSVTIEGDKCPWNPDRQLVMIGLKGENMNEKEIPPSNLVFLIDVSGSMAPANRLPLLKQAFKYLVDQLRPEDRVSIVVYASACGIVLESTPGTDKPKIKAAIDMLQAEGATAGGEGIQMAYKVAKQNYIHGGNNRVILATDGDFNVGVSSTSELVKFIEKKRDDGIFLTILGFGMGNYKDGRMEQLSNAGNGNYAYIDNILEAKKMFGTELWGTLYAIAKDVKIQVEFNPARVKAYRLVGYENRMLNKEDFNNDKKDAGDIGCGHTVTALYEIIPADSHEQVTDIDPLEYTKQVVGNSKDLMSVKIRYKRPNEDTSNLITQKVEWNKLTKTNNFLFASSVAEFGMLLRESEHRGNASFADVLTRSRKSMGKDEYGYKAEFIKMVEMAEVLDR